MASMKRIRFSDVVATTGVSAPAEPVSPARGFDIRWSIQETPFGAALAATTPFGLCALEFLGEAGASHTPRIEALLAALAVRWSDANLIADGPASSVAAPLAAAFKAAVSGLPPAGGRGSLPLHLRGTAFQIAVWQKLLAIPSGSLVTYGELAASLGRPKAARAVGSAVGANPIAIFVPCHRVVAASGTLGGYRWGSALKGALIDREKLGAAGKPRD